MTKHNRDAGEVVDELRENVEDLNAVIIDLKDELADTRELVTRVLQYSATEEEVKALSLWAGIPYP